MGKKAKLGEVFYQVDKTWRARSSLTASDEEEVKDYYVNEDLSFGVKYVQPKDLSEKIRLITI